MLIRYGEAQEAQKAHRSVAQDQLTTKAPLSEPIVISLLVHLAIVSMVFALGLWS
jgi:hypothetical protein